MSDLEALVKEVEIFCAERNWDQFHGLKELAIGVVTESAELLELFRFKTAEESEKFFAEVQNRVKVEDEISDVLFFILRLAGRFEINLPSALRSKIAKNAEKYPVAKAYGSNKKYDAL